MDEVEKIKTFCVYNYSQNLKAKAIYYNRAYNNNALIIRLVLLSLERKNLAHHNFVSAIQT